MQHGWMPGRLLVALCALLAALAFSAAPAAAKAGFFIGAGLANQTAAGELDGEEGPELEQGDGMALRFGYGFTQNFAVEYLNVNTDHTAKRDSGAEGDATLGYSTLALRASTGMGNGEAFLRLGSSDLFGGYNLDVEIGATDTEATGNGSSIGGGYEFFFGSAGIELSYTRHRVTFDDIEVGNNEINEEWNAPIDTALVMISLYF